MSRFYARDGAGDLLARYSFIEPLLSGKRVLELGAAGATDGASALFLAERGAAAVVSIDDDPAAVERAQRECRHPFVQFKTTPIEALPERAFDLVVLADGATLAADPARVATLHGLLALRGRFVTALPASEEGGGLSRLVGGTAHGELPSFESFVGALGEHFAFVEVATQSATVGYVMAMGQDPEPEISIDGSLAGTGDTAWYVAVCGDAPCNLQGLTIVALPTQPLFESAAERDRIASSGGAAAEEALRTAAEAQAERDALRVELETALGERDQAQAGRDALAAELETVRVERDEAHALRNQVASELATIRGERDEARAALDAARLEGEKKDSELAAWEAEHAGLIADRDAIAEARAETDRAAAALREALEAQAARLREAEGALDAERETNFELRATADKVQALEALRAREAGEAERVAEERAQALAELAGLRSLHEEADAALQAARAELQASRSGLEAALARATTAEARSQELEEAGDATASAATARMGQLELELSRLRDAGEAREAELAAAREEAAARAAELVVAKGEARALAVERDALRERADTSRTSAEELQARASELEVRAAEVDRLTAELARRDDVAAEASGVREMLEAQLAELGARLESEEERLRRAEDQGAEARALLEAARADLAENAGGGEAVARLAGELEEAVAARDRLERLAAEARNAADEAQAQAAELEAELQAVRWDKDELEQRLQGQPQGAPTGGADVARLRDEVAQRSHRIVELEREVARLEAVVAEFTSTGIATSPTLPPADLERLQELERRVEEAERRAVEAEARAAEKPAEAAAEVAKAAERLKAERDSLQAQVVERDARLARLQREVVDKTDRLGRLAKEMGELKAKGIGKLFK